MKPCEITLWHVTVLSNFARAYDKYTRRYSKAGIPESTFPDRFFLLQEEDLGIGIQKASALLEKLAMPGNRLLALRANVLWEDTLPNARTGLGRCLNSPSILVDQVAFIEAATSEKNYVSVEEAMALSLQLLRPELLEYQELTPRTFSVLPIARGCQAACPFCFSEASVSADQEQAKLKIEDIRERAKAARDRGAERFVITGGGEPGLVRHETLRQIIAAGNETLGKTILITNGHHLGVQEPEALIRTLQDYADAGLQVLAISRHHHDDDVSGQMMGLQTDVGALAQIWRENRARWPDLRLRFTCVLQRNGIDTASELEAYVEWASRLGVPELCFKELYVSTSVESVYHRNAANEWSHAHQVPLALVLDFADRHGFSEVGRLPWGSPVFKGAWHGQPLKIAAYTEPSLFWERTHGIARSWNLMADGQCLASLEDRQSAVSLPLAA